MYTQKAIKDIFAIIFTFDGCECYLGRVFTVVRLIYWMKVFHDANVVDVLAGLLVRFNDSSNKSLARGNQRRFAEHKFLYT